jgi:hypothetical protein
MLPDIKTFSEVLDIKNPNAVVTITYRVHGLVVGWVEFNGNRCSEGTNTFIVNLLEPMELISTIEKYNEGTSAIEITDFSVNGYNAVPTYQHLSSTGNGYHDFIGIWQMSIEEPFYQWYHNASGQGWIA